jgi:CRP-like cAMP-binding protein
MYKKQIRGFLSSIVPFSDKDWSLFDKRLAYKEFEKNELLLRAGETENFIYFIVEGVTRIFQLKNDMEYTLRFNFPITPFNSYASFISRTPSLINVEALTDIKVLRMSYNDMQSLYDEAEGADRMGRRMIELLYVQREIKELEMHSKTAEDYYFELIKTNKQLVDQIPQKYLASYLGITPESLSRIKKKSRS